MQWIPVFDETNPTAPGAPRPVILHRELVLAARRRGGECLSSPAEVHNHPGQVRWRCRADHEFTLARDAVMRRGEWCKTCLAQAANRGSLRERVVRAVTQSLFGVEFPRVRPNWTTELDGYNAKVRFAWEHQGRQHYGFVPAFHGTPAEFERQRERDARKIEDCRRQGITLVVIPSLFDMLPEEELPGFLRAACEQAGRADLLPADFDDRAIDLSTAYSPDYALDYAWLCGEAALAGARIVETGWLADDYPYHFECLTPGCGKTWRRTATSFRHRRKQGHPAGCSHCSARRGAEGQRKDYGIIVETARDRAITVLSTAADLYSSPDAHCRLRCNICAAAGHPADWSVPRAVVTKGIYGCHRCAFKLKLTGEVIQLRAAARGWEVVAMPADLKNNRDKVSLRCQRGHLFDKTIHAMEASGCPACFNEEGRGGNSTRRLTQTQAEAAARALGWELLDPYRSNKRPLTYRCLDCGEVATRTHNMLRAMPCPRGCHDRSAAGMTLPPAPSR